MKGSNTKPNCHLFSELEEAYHAVICDPHQTTAGEFFAQFGEDRILSRFFSETTEGFFVEVGAYNGVEMSNTLALERRGWRGILVEADPELAEQCRENRPNAVVVNCAATAPGGTTELGFSVAVASRGLSAVTMDKQRLGRIRHYTGSEDVRDIVVPARCLDHILAEQHVRHVDVLTVDVEGHEWEVLQGTDLSRWKPTLLIIERNSWFLPPRLLWRLHRHGYRYGFSTGPNDWFLRDERGNMAGLGYWPGMLTTQYGINGLRYIKRSVLAHFRSVLSRRR